MTCVGGNSALEMKSHTSRSAGVGLFLMLFELDLLNTGFMHTTLRQKWGGGICLNSCAYAPELVAMLHVRLTFSVTVVAFWKWQLIVECELLVISGTCVDTLW